MPDLVANPTEGLVIENNGKKYIVSKPIQDRNPDQRYWVVEKGGNGKPYNWYSYQCIADSDIDTLPKLTDDDDSILNDLYLPCAGSECLVVDSGNLYILNIDNVWQQVGAPIVDEQNDVVDEQ